MDTGLGRMLQAVGLGAMMLYIVVTVDIKVELATQKKMFQKPHGAH